MKQTAFKLIDKLLGNPSRLSLLALDKVLTVGIPFNAPHGFRIREISDSVVITLPNRKLNHNHLGGIHACAIATIGEFCAGLSILTHCGISKYRIILSELSVKYTYQGRSALEGRCRISQIDPEVLNAALLREGKHLQEMKTVVTDENQKEVAVVTTVWQLKSWDQVQTKG